MTSDKVTDREVVVFLAELVGTLKKSTPRRAYVGDLMYRFDMAGDIIGVSRVTDRHRTVRLDAEVGE